VIVGTLARAGADILFAAGNCGPQCADGRCGTSTGGTIYGANSSADVCCVAGVDIHKQRVGYSSMGPGLLNARKPDLAGYTHFAGSGVHSIDSGTSAATPVVAGFFAAVRSKIPETSKSPTDFRNLMIAGLDRTGIVGHDLGLGFGIVDGTTFLAHLQGPGITTADPKDGAAMPPPTDGKSIRDVSQP
jgi:subtilisin family serine protease